MFNIKKTAPIFVAILMIMSLFAMPAMAYSDETVDYESPEGVSHLTVGDTTTYEWTVDASEVEYQDDDDENQTKEYSLFVYDAETDDDVEDREEPIVSEEMSVEEHEDDEDKYVVSVSVEDTELLDEEVESGDNIVTHLHDETDDTHVSENDVLVGYVIVDSVDSESATLQALDVGINDVITSSTGIMDVWSFDDGLDMEALETTFESNVDYDGDYAQALDEDMNADFADASDGVEDGEIIDSQATVNGDDFRVYLNEVPEDVEETAVVYDEELESILVQNIDSDVDFDINPHQGYSTFGEFIIFDDVDFMDLFQF